MHAIATALERRQQADLPQRSQAAPAEQQRDFNDLVTMLIRRGQPEQPQAGDNAAPPVGRARGHNDDGSHGRGVERRRSVLPEQAAFDAPPGRLDKDLRPRPDHHARPPRPDHACDHPRAPRETPAEGDDAATPAIPQTHECGAEHSCVPASDPSPENTESNETGAPALEPNGLPAPLPAIATLPETPLGAVAAPTPAVVASTADAGASSESAAAVVGIAAMPGTDAASAGALDDDLVALSHATTPGAQTAPPNAGPAAQSPEAAPAAGAAPLLSAPTQEDATAARAELNSPRDPASPLHAPASDAADIRIVAGPAEDSSSRLATAANNDEALERLMVTNAVAAHPDRSGLALDAKLEASERKDVSDVKALPIAAAPHRIAETQGPSENAVARNPGSVPVQVAQPIIRAVRNGTDRIEIHLSPAELGRVDVKLDIAPDGRVLAVFAVDRPQTADLLQRDARELARTLQEAGLRADMGSLSFNLRNQNQGHAQSWMANLGDRRSFAPERAELERAAFYRPMIVSDDQVDLHV